MDNKEYDSEIIKFHAEVMLNLLVKSENQYMSDNEVNQVIQRFVQSFNTSIAKSFLKEKEKEMTHPYDFSHFPEQFLNHVDTEEISIKFVNDKIDSILTSFAKIIEENTVNNIDIAIEEKNKFVDEIAYFINKIGDNQDSKSDTRLMSDILNKIIAFSYLNENTSVGNINEYFNFKNYLNKNFRDDLIEKIKPNYKNIIQERINNSFPHYNRSYMSRNYSI